MCTLLATRAHPNYDLILISNRDEYLDRSTHETEWKKGKNCEILCPYDLSSRNKIDESVSTWCGVNKFGRISTLLNLKLNDSFGTCEKKVSRGVLPVAFLDNDDNDEFVGWNTYEKFAQKYGDLNETNNFSLFIGDIKLGEYCVIDSLGKTHEVLTKQKPDLALSNAPLNNGKKWRKVVQGEELLDKVKFMNSEKEVIDSCFNIASTNSLNDEHLGKLPIPDLLKNTIFVPPIDVSDELNELNVTNTTSSVRKIYGTRSQIVVLVDKERTKVKFIEKIIYESNDDTGKSSCDNPKKELHFSIDLK